MGLINAVECDGNDCKVLLRADSEEFFTLYGNLCTGINGGLLGNNIGEDGKIKGPKFYCFSCFRKETEKATGEQTTR